MRTNGGVGEDGSITHLQQQGGAAWASPTSPLGAFTYKTLNDSDWMPFTYSYLAQHQPSPGFWKPGSNNWTESTIFRPVATKLHVKADKTSAIVEMVMPARSTSKYGSWARIYLTVTVDAAHPHNVGLTYTTLGKGIVSIGESTSITFKPVPALKPPQGACPFGVKLWSAHPVLEQCTLRGPRTRSWEQCTLRGPPTRSWEQCTHRGPPQNAVMICTILLLVCCSQ